MKIKKMIVCLVAFSTSITVAEVKITYGVSTHQNKRPYQEDRFVRAVVGGGAFFGVYDGHGGAQVSDFLAKNLHRRYFARAKGSIKEKFTRAFEQADYVSQNSWHDEGSTALVAYIGKDDVLHCAWVGDTRAVLECGGKVCFFTNDHKPDRKDEKERIERVGGKIEMYGVWRVNGLAVSRSIGDAVCKERGIGQIIATPEYTRMQLKPDNHFMIMASDGLWDVMSNEETVAIVNRALRNNTLLMSIAKILQDAAIKKGSGDNITVCVVQFIWEPDSMLRRWWNWLRGI